MRNQFRKTVAGSALAILLLASAASAQAPAPAPARGGQAAPTGSVVVANPTYASVLMELPVNKPAAEVWARIGKYCDIGEWARFNCTIVSGTGEVGTVRSIGSEVLVGKTELSYTYAQTPREGRPYDMYHGTLEVRPVTPTTSKIVYTLMFDNSMLADDAAREANKTQRRNQFMPWLENMKILAEGGTLPPAPARGGRGGGAGGAGGRGGGAGAGAPAGGPPAGGGQRQ
jgi:hypothetical protein